MTVFDWAASHTEAQRIEHSFSVRARYEVAVRNVEATIWPSLNVAMKNLPVALTMDAPDVLIGELRRLSSIGELARFEAEKLEGRA
jgi:hypothetical protein